MTREQASSIIAVCREASAIFNAIAEQIEMLTDPEEQRHFRRAIAELMSAKFVEIELPIIEQFPDLDPDI